MLQAAGYGSGRASQPLQTCSGVEMSAPRPGVTSVDTAAASWDQVGEHLTPREVCQALPVVICCQDCAYRCHSVVRTSNACSKLSGSSTLQQPFTALHGSLSFAYKFTEVMSDLFGILLNLLASSLSRSRFRIRKMMLLTARHPGCLRA